MKKLKFLSLFLILLIIVSPLPVAKAEYVPSPEQILPENPGGSSSNPTTPEEENKPSSGGESGSGQSSAQTGEQFPYYWIILAFIFIILSLSFALKGKKRLKNEKEQVNEFKET